MAYVRAHDTKANARGRVVKRYEVVYRAKVRTEDGRTVSRLRQETHPTKAAADARMAELNARKHRRAVDPAEQRARGNRTFDEWAGDWLDSQQTRVALGRLKADTADDYGKLLDRYVMPELGAMAIADVDALAIDQFMARLSVRKTRTGAPLHPKTIKHAWNVLRWVLAYANRKDAIESNPVDKTEFSSDRVTHATGDREDFEPNPLTGDQLGALCAALRGEYPAHDGQPLPAYPVYALMVEFMANTGLRASEVSGLEIADVTFAPALAGQPPKASVRVNRTKKRKGGNWVVGTPKSKRSANRVVPLPGWLAAKLADYLASVHPRASDPAAPLWPGRADQAARAGQSASDWLTALDWSAPVEMGTFYRRTFARALAAVGLPVTTPAKPARERKTAPGEIVTEPATEPVAGIRLHDLRHTAAVAWLLAGVNVVQVSRWLGHAQPTVTMNVYGDWVPDEAENPLPEPKSVSNVVAMPNRTG
jgi:integrase